MPNIHGLFSSSNRKDDDSDSDRDDSNNRYVGGIGDRGGGSGLAVQPNPDNIFSRAESDSNAAGRRSRRTITMFRSGFRVDRGPYRRLDDPNNREFLTYLARGMTPRELLDEDGEGDGDIEINLIDKRTREYDPKVDDVESDDEPDKEKFTSFSGTGNVLSSSTLTSTDGVIDPAAQDESTTIDDAPSDATSVQIRLICGKRLVIKLSKSAALSELALRINRSGQAGSENYVLVSGYPPAPITDLNQSVLDAGVAGASLIQRKA